MSRRLPARLLSLLSGVMTLSAGAQDMHQAARRGMTGEIAAMALQTAAETGRKAFAPRVMQAMGKVERHRFVAAGDEAQAYRNQPLAIGSGQTISQPYIVALMTDLLDLAGSEKVLEVGTGSGYQAAVLAELAGTVYSIEIVEALGHLAAKRLAAAGYRNIVTRIGDGYQGWPEAAPFDAIMVTAAAREVPPALLAQLKPGGRMVIPVGIPGGHQDLMLLAKASDGAIQSRRVLAVRFVPMTGASAR